LSDWRAASGPRPARLARDHPGERKRRRHHAWSPGPGHPAAARVWDYWASGRDYYRADAELAGEIEKICPGVPRMATDSRDFTGRAVARASKEGIA